MAESSVRRVSKESRGNIETQRKKPGRFGAAKRHHYLGCRAPFGAQLRYWVRNREQDLACLLWTSPAWRMQESGPVDRLERWPAATPTPTHREQTGDFDSALRRSQGTSSKILALSARRVPGDWERQYGCRPLLLETLVDASRFRGIQARGTNWIHTGQTAAGDPLSIFPDGDQLAGRLCPPDIKVQQEGEVTPAQRLQQMQGMVQDKQSIQILTARRTNSATSSTRTVAEPENRSRLSRCRLHEFNVSYIRAHGPSLC